MANGKGFSKGKTITGQEQAIFEIIRLLGADSSVVRTEADTIVNWVFSNVSTSKEKPEIMKALYDVAFVISPTIVQSFDETRLPKKIDKVSYHFYVSKFTNMLKKTLSDVSVSRRDILANFTA